MLVPPPNHHGRIKQTPRLDPKSVLVQVSKCAVEFDHSTLLALLKYCYIRYDIMISSHLMLKRCFASLRLRMFPVDRSICTGTCETSAMWLALKPRSVRMSMSICVRRTCEKHMCGQQPVYEQSICKQSAAARVSWQSNMHNVRNSLQHHCLQTSVSLAYSPMTSPPHTQNRRIHINIQYIDRTSHISCAYSTWTWTIGSSMPNDHHVYNHHHRGENRRPREQYIQICAVRASAHWTATIQLCTSPGLIHTNSYSNPEMYFTWPNSLSPTLIPPLDAQSGLHVHKHTCAVRGWSLNSRRSVMYSTWPLMPLSRKMGMISAVRISITWMCGKQSPECEVEVGRA